MSAAVLTQQNREGSQNKADVSLEAETHFTDVFLSWFSGEDDTVTPTIHPHTHTHFQFSLNPPIKHQIQDLFCCEVDHNRIPVRHNTWSTSSILYAAKGNLRLVNDVNCSYVSLSAGSSVLKTALCCQL